MKDLYELAESHGSSEQELKSIKKLLEIDKQIAVLSTTRSLLVWDQEIFMPSDGVENRSEQMSLLTKLIHDNQTNPEIPEILHKLGVTEETQYGKEQLPQKIRAWLRAKYKSWKRETSLPPALLQEIVKLSIKSFHVWKEAREKDDFSIFVPYLEKTLKLQKDKADCLGYKESRYNALLNEFEEGLTVSKLDPIFQELQQKIKTVYQTILENQKREKLKLPELPVSEQEKISKLLMEYIGSTNKSCRLDVSAHPFSLHVGVKDSRITTRFIESNAFSNIFSILHEIGHALYDLNVDPLYHYTVCAEGASYGIHESQSRFVENVIGRSKEFWKHFLPKIQNISSRFSEMTLDDCMRHVLHVSPNLIRVESDEVTYAFHVIIRYELERELINDGLKVHELPELWNEKIKTYLGLEVPNYAKGVLQDVHWSEGYFGYFPSYELGNLYASKLWEELNTEMPDYASHIQAGEWNPIREWLGKKVHIHGASKLPQELIPLSVDSNIKYLKTRYLAQV